MYQQNRPQFPMPGIMKGVSPLSGLTDGDEITAEEQRMGRNPASKAEQMLQGQGNQLDRFRMEQFQQMFEDDTRKRLQKGYDDALRARRSY